LSSLGRWTIGLEVDNGIQATVECHQSQQASEEATHQEEGPLADVVDRVFKSEDFAVDEEDTKACEQFLDKFLEIEEKPALNTSTILDTAWEETLGDLFPDLAECNF